MPESLETLLDYGIIQEVVRPLMSGKEAQVFVVVAGGERCVAKVYKEAHQRTFKHRSSYTEGRRTRNTRDQRARNKRTQHGRKVDEEAWRTTEADMIYRLRDAGVRVPEPINFVDGVLVMELVQDADGQAAPRLGDLSFSASEARDIYLKLIREVVRMLCAGVIHGDLSEFNVLMGADGPVVIDFPQSVDPAANMNARELLLRDVENLHRFLARFAPDEPVLPYGEEIWLLFQENRLQPDTPLEGRYLPAEGKADTSEVMALVEDARRDEDIRRNGWRPRDGEDEDEAGDVDVHAPVRAKAPAPFRTVVDFAKKAEPERPAKAPKAARTRSRRRRGGKKRAEPAKEGAERSAQGEAKSADAAKSAGPKRRRRRTRGGARAKTTAKAKAEGGKANDRAKPDGSKAAPSNETKRRAKAKPASGGTRAPREASGADGKPPRARRRRRKASTPR